MPWTLLENFSNWSVGILYDFINPESLWQCAHVAGMFVAYTFDFTSFAERISWLPWQLAHSAVWGSPFALRMPWTLVLYLSS